MTDLNGVNDVSDPLLAELLDLGLEAARRAGALLRDGLYRTTWPWR